MKSQECPRCSNTTRLAKRTFSDQALAALVVWKDLSEKLIDEPICEDCYEELRDVLIERIEDVKAVEPRQFNRAS
ncbi:MAG: hypothetical protein V4655_12830 [Bdellovibrionota bacterium]|nr:MAG: hypothetical protein EOP10_17255 [Pseudomonadota bacterium]